MIKKALTILEKSEARFLGCVLNNVYSSALFSEAELDMATDVMENMVNTVITAIIIQNPDLRTEKGGDYGYL